MTCCVGLIDPGSKRVLLGADSAAVDIRGFGLEVRRDRKVFRNGPYRVCFTSSFRMGQLLQTADLPLPRGDDPFLFMVREFIPAVRTAMADGGFRTRKDEVETGGTFLVAWADNLFGVMDDFQVSQSAADFAAVGCGAELALGALAATESIATLTAEERVELALSAAERFSSGVRRPFYTEWTEP